MYAFRIHLARAAAALALLAPGALAAQQPARPAPVPSIEERTADLPKIDGYFPLYWEERTGSLFLEIPRFDSEFLLSTIRRAEERVLVDRVTWLATAAPSGQARAIAGYWLEALEDRLLDEVVESDADRAHREMLADQIDRFLGRIGDAPPVMPAAPAPPGAPIGDPDPSWLEPAPWGGR